jgi:SAM-dependent methyltransferase
MRDEFFRSGEDHVHMIFETIRRVFDPQFAPKRTLDFGCGVGRLLVPFARRNSSVVGVDVSQSMLLEARLNCERYNVRDVELIPSDDSLSTVKGSFDLVHSSLVLQHIPWKRGTRLIDELLSRVRSGGVIAIQFYYGCNAPRLLRTLVRLRYASSTVNSVRNVWRRQPFSDPPMQLHVYDASSIMRRLKNVGFASTYQRLESPGSGEFESTMLFARRSSHE